MHGKGKDTWPDGSYYEGDYAHGKKNGYGKIVWTKNSFYEG